MNVYIRSFIELNCSNYQGRMSPWDPPFAAFAVYGKCVYLHSLASTFM